MRILLLNCHFDYKSYCYNSDLLIVQVCLLFFFCKSFYSCQQQPEWGKHILPYPCWDWISILQCSTMPLCPSGKPRGPWKKMWSQREWQKSCKRHTAPAETALIIYSVFSGSFVWSSGVKEICMMFFFVFLVYLYMCVFVFVYIYAHLSRMTGVIWNWEVPPQCVHVTWREFHGHQVLTWEQRKPVQTRRIGQPEHL